MFMFASVLVHDHMYLLCRSKVHKLIIRLNDEKEVLKKEGICVDGKHYKITFKGLQIIFTF